MAKLILQNQTEPVSPGVGCTTLYVDSTDGNLKIKNSEGNIKAITDKSYVDLWERSMLADVLIIGGGAPGADRNRSGNGIGGGGGDVCFLCNYKLLQTNIIKVGGRTDGQMCNDVPGCSTMFNSIVVKGGCGYGISGNGNQPGVSYNVGSSYGKTGGAGGAGGAGGDASINCIGHGGCGCCYDILGYPRRFGAGGGGTTTNASGKVTYGNGGICCGGDGGGCYAMNGGTRGAGGGNSDWVLTGGAGHEGAVIVSYPIGCGYDFIGGNCVYCCDGKKIHIFDKYDKQYYLIKNIND